MLEFKLRLFLSYFSADLQALMKSLNLGPSLDNESGHDDHDGHADPHADHDHTGARRKKRSSHEYHMEPEGNNTWDQVGRSKCLKLLAPRIFFFLTSMSICFCIFIFSIFQYIYFFHTYFNELSKFSIIHMTQGYLCTETAVNVSTFYF